MFRKLLLIGIVALVFALVVVALPSKAAPAPDVLGQAAPDALNVFRAELSGVNEVPAVGTNASGVAVMVLSEDMSQLFYRVMVSDIQNINAAHIHLGAAGVEGGVVFPLYDPATTVFDPAHPISGTLTLEAAQVSELVAGNYYVNVHTTANPDGEIRGQLGLFTPPADYHAIMLGQNEIPPVDTTASGIASFELSGDSESLTYEVAVSDIVSITLAHIHTGNRQESGPPKVTLYSGIGPFGPDDPINGTATLDAQDLLNLLTGYLYINVHTSDNPAGEIRGQLSSGYEVYEAKLRGIEEVPPVTTDAKGRAVMVLDNDLSSLHYRVMATNIISITAAHIHEGEPGEEGGIIFPLFDPNTTVFDPGNPISGTLNLNQEQLLTLVAGDYYVNVHTQENPDGEIRGQLDYQNPPRELGAVLTGDQETPPVSTPANGLANFYFGDEVNTLHYQVSVADIQDITLAHIHPGLPGQAGPPLITLYGSGDPRAFDEDNPIAGWVDVEAMDVLNLLTGYYYVNVHTQEYPPGEIRGQIFAFMKTFFPVVLN